VARSRFVFQARGYRSIKRNSIVSIRGTQFGFGPSRGKRLALDRLRAVLREVDRVRVCATRERWSATPKFSKYGPGVLLGGGKGTPPALLRAPLY
jgi:hypothetical protein